MELRIFIVTLLLGLSTWGLLRLAAALKGPA